MPGHPRTHPKSFLETSIRPIPHISGKTQQNSLSLRHAWPNVHQPNNHFHRSDPPMSDFSPRGKDECLHYGRYWPHFCCDHLWVGCWVMRHQVGSVHKSSTWKWKKIKLFFPMPLMSLNQFNSWLLSIPWFIHVRHSLFRYKLPTTGSTIKCLPPSLPATKAWSKPAEVSLMLKDSSLKSWILKISNALGKCHLVPMASYNNNNNNNNNIYICVCVCKYTYMN